ncbi:PrsW family intramembrane metalloprotease [Streptomyces sp. SID8382]|nr:PrsW family intramembrane metalloprotease [Streptomyces sp. SID8382]
MALLMVAASVYAVVQLLVLSSPTRSVRMSTVLLAIAVGVYGAGVAAGLLELAYTRGVAEATGESLAEVVKTASYTVDPVIEELMKLAPLLLVAWNVRIRRQWGLTDYVVLGAALGAGFGLLEAVARYGLDADRAIAHPAGGWAVPDSLRAPYIPGVEQVFSAWFPAPQGALALGDRSPVAATSPHLVYTALAALGVGVLLRGRGWTRVLGVLPLAATSGLHMLTNYAAAHPMDRDAAERVDTFEGMLWAVPLVCLAVAMAVDLRRLWRGKAVAPGVLLRAERAGRTGLSALVSYGSWCVPWSTLIALRFARLRRSLLYGVVDGAPSYPGAESLHRTVAWSAAQIDASDREQAWRGRLTGRGKGGRHTAGPAPEVVRARVRRSDDSGAAPPGDRLLPVRCRAPAALRFGHRAARPRRLRDRGPAVDGLAAGTAAARLAGNARAAAWRGAGHDPLACLDRARRMRRGRAAAVATGRRRAPGRPRDPQPPPPRRPEQLPGPPRLRPPPAVPPGPHPTRWWPRPCAGRRPSGSDRHHTRGRDPRGRVRGVGHRLDGRERWHRG